jgi:molybdopterin-guanine dinucleotide biosynthesis protein A
MIMPTRPFDRPRIRGVILAGGGASRYEGKPKGLEVVGGERVLDRLVHAFVAAFGDLPLLVANAADAMSWRPDLAVVRDIIPGKGALGGIYTAVVKGPAPLVLVAWDMPFVDAGLLRALALGLESHDACLPESDGPRGIEPLCAAYGPACAAAIEASLEHEDYRAIAFHQAIDVGILPLTRVRELGDPARLFFNVNTPADLALAQDLCRLGSSP